MPNHKECSDLPDDISTSYNGSSLAGRKIILVAQTIGTLSGGEAIKAYQYANYLKQQGADLTIITHQRSITEMGADPSEHDYHLVPDSILQKLMWFIGPLRIGLPVHFHLKARKIIQTIAQPGPQTVVHYIAPISPVVPRFPPRGYRIVMGPLSGGIYYPPAFRSRMGLKERLRARLHNATQRVFGLLLNDKARADKILVSGYERTRASLRLARCRDAQMVEVVDSGIDLTFGQRPRTIHTGRKSAFMFSGRLVAFKAVDLAIRAVARAAPDITLSVYGDGPERTALEKLTHELDVKDRITFLGWTEHAQLIDSYSAYRGYIFPSLAEANGIVMQEAMMVGLPVIALRWGGPLGLANDSSALLVTPESEEQVINDIATAMNRLAEDPDLAEALSLAARAQAEAAFTWETVAKSWMQAY